MRVYWLKRSVGSVFIAVRIFGKSDPRPDMGCEHDLCRRGGQPLGLGSGSVQDMKRVLEDRRAWPMAGEIQPDAASIAGDHGG